MRFDGMLKDVEERLEKLNIYELRQVARVVGVHRPADGKKSRVVEEILGIASGEIEPIEQSHRGAPPKSQQYDEKLVADITACRKAHLSQSFEIAPEEEQKNVLRVNDSGGVFNGEVSGFLKFCENRLLLYPDGDLSREGVTVHEMFIKRYSLREGDLVEGRCACKGESGISALAEVYSVNGISVGDSGQRRAFDELTHVYPQTTLKTEHGKDDIYCRITDLFAPLALGQRGFIKAPTKSDKTELIKQIAAGISCNYPQIKTIIILIDELPEVISDFKKSLNGATLLYTTFASPRESHIQTARLGFEYAKRIAEDGGDAVILFDGVTRLARVYGNGYADEIKKLLFCACNAEEGGSVTVLSTLIDGGGECEEFSPLANMTVSFSSYLAEKRLFPAIDIKNSFADREDKLLTKEELTAANQMRKLTAEEALNLFKETQSNAELLKRFN